MISYLFLCLTKSLQRWGLLLNEIIGRENSFFVIEKGTKNGNGIDVVASSRL